MLPLLTSIYLRVSRFIQEYASRLAESQKCIKTSQRRGIDEQYRFLEDTKQKVSHDSLTGSILGRNENFVCRNRNIEMTCHTVGCNAAKYYSSSAVLSS